MVAEIKVNCQWALIIDYLLVYNTGTHHLFHIDIINVDINKIKIKISMYIMCEIIIIVYMKCTITINKYETIVPIVNLWSQVLKIFMQFK